MKLRLIQTFCCNTNLFMVCFCGKQNQLEHIFNNWNTFKQNEEEQSKLISIRFSNSRRLVEKVIHQKEVKVYDLQCNKLKLI